MDNNKIEVDFLDKWSGIKEDFNKADLAEKRFKYSYKLLYIISLLNVVTGAFLYYNSLNLTADSSISSTEVLFAGIIYFMFTFAFHKLKMPIMLGILAFSMLADKVYTMILVHKINGLSIFIMLMLFSAFIQALRSRQNLATNGRKVLKSIVAIVFFIFIGLSILIAMNPTVFENTEWTAERSKELQTIIFQKYFNHLIETKYDESRAKTISEKTAECSINQIKTKYPNYIIFVEGLNEESEILSKENKIELKCLTKTLVSEVKKNK